MKEEKWRYAGPHLHAALKCLRAGYPENAASWMNRDLGELDAEEALPASLIDCGTYIGYEVASEVFQGRDGEGI